MPLSKARDRERKRLVRLETGTNTGYCQECGRYGIVDRHHKGLNHNNDEGDNLALLCPNCHADIHRNHIQPKSNLLVEKKVQPNIPGLIIEGNKIRLESKPVQPNDDNVEMARQMLPIRMRAYAIADELDADGNPMPDF